MSLRLLMLAPLLLAAATPSPSPSPAAAPQPAVGAPLDYETLSHVVGIASLRAGSHDPSGVNDYYFTVTLYALLNSAEERNADFTARKKIVVDRGTFGDTKIDSLAVWKPDAKQKNYKEHKIEGGAIRELTARAMQEFAVGEGDLCVMTEIVLYERNKKFFFFGDDTLVAKTSYYPIPPTKFDVPARSDQALDITDDKGTLVNVTVKY